jgi:AraC-like DNA-binding protein/anti-anti-sigma regulatory factor
VTSADKLRIKVERRGPLLVLAVSGELGAGSAAGFTAAVERAAADGAARVVVDLSGVRTVNADGARALAAVASPAEGRRHVVLRSLRPAPRRLVRAICPDLDLAGPGAAGARPDASAEPDPGSASWALVRKSRQARSLARQAITDTRRVADMVAGTEDKIAATLLLLAPRRPADYHRVMALSQAARRYAERLRELTGDAPAQQASAPAATGNGRDAPAETLRRAIAYIEQHAGDPIGAADIAAAACVTARTVQLAFRRHLGITPLGYLRQVRLERAHRELLAAQPAPGIVTRIAADWRFTNLSRFSANYRAAYGVLPSQTLHDGKAPGSGR